MNFLSYRNRVCVSGFIAAIALTGCPGLEDLDGNTASSTDTTITATPPTTPPTPVTPPPSPRPEPSSRTKGRPPSKGAPTLNTGGGDTPPGSGEDTPPPSDDEGGEDDVGKPNRVGLHDRRFSDPSLGRPILGDSPSAPIQARHDQKRHPVATDDRQITDGKPNPNTEQVTLDPAIGENPSLDLSSHRSRSGFRVPGRRHRSLHRNATHRNSLDLTRPGFSSVDPIEGDEFTDLLSLTSVHTGTSGNVPAADLRVKQIKRGDWSRLVVGNRFYFDPRNLYSGRRIVLSDSLREEILTSLPAGIRARNLLDQQLLLLHLLHIRFTLQDPQTPSLIAPARPNSLDDFIDSSQISQLEPSQMSRLKPSQIGLLEGPQPTRTDSKVDSKVSIYEDHAGEDESDESNYDDLTHSPHSGSYHAHAYDHKRQAWATPGTSFSRGSAKPGRSQRRGHPFSRPSSSSSSTVLAGGRGTPISLIVPSSIRPSLIDHTKPFLNPHPANPTANQEDGEEYEDNFEDISEYNENQTVASRQNGGLIDLPSTCVDSKIITALLPFFDPTAAERLNSQAQDPRSNENKQNNVWLVNYSATASGPAQHQPFQSPFIRSQTEIAEGDGKNIHIVFPFGNGFGGSPSINADSVLFQELRNLFTPEILSQYAAAGDLVSTANAALSQSQDSRLTLWGAGKVGSGLALVTQYALLWQHPELAGRVSVVAYGPSPIFRNPQALSRFLELQGVNRDGSSPVALFSAQIPSSRLSIGSMIAKRNKSVGPSSQAIDHVTIFQNLLAALNPVDEKADAKVSTSGARLDAGNSLPPSSTSTDSKRSDVQLSDSSGIAQVQSTTPATHSSIASGSSSTDSKRPAMQLSDSSGIAQDQSTTPATHSSIASGSSSTDSKRSDVQLSDSSGIAQYQSTIPATGSTIVPASSSAQQRPVRPASASTTRSTNVPASSSAQQRPVRPASASSTRSTNVLALPSNDSKRSDLKLLDSAEDVQTQPTTPTTPSAIAPGSSSRSADSKRSEMSLSASARKRHILHHGVPKLQLPDPTGAPSQKIKSVRFDYALNDDSSESKQPRSAQQRPTRPFSAPVNRVTKPRAVAKRAESARRASERLPLGELWSRASAPKVVSNYFHRLSLRRASESSGRETPTWKIRQDARLAEARDRADKFTFKLKEEAQQARIDRNNLEEARREQMESEAALKKGLVDRMKAESVAAKEKFRIDEEARLAKLHARKALDRKLLAEQKKRNDDAAEELRIEREKRNDERNEIRRRAIKAQDAFLKKKQAEEEQRRQKDVAAQIEANRKADEKRSAAVRARSAAVRARSAAVRARSAAGKK